jgi:AcrR family transcriptional regulator
MGISERKEREKGEKKQLIMDAAMKMFLEDGYAKTSIRNIADAIEYSPGTIYLYYKDKDELLYEVQRQAFLKLAAAFDASVISDQPIERLMQLGKTYVAFGLDNPELYDLMFIIRAPTNVDEKTHSDNGEKCFEYLVDCLKICIDNKLIRMNDVMEGSLQLWAMVHGLVSLNLRCRLKIVLMGGDDVRQVLDSAVEGYIRAITI